MRVLFIEDEEESVAVVVDDLKENNHETKVEDFEFGLDRILDYSPDIVVLDLAQYGNSAESKAPGAGVYHEIWERCFCPIIIYSAYPELLADLKEKPHPFVTLVKKGKDSPTEFAQAINRFEPHVELLRETQSRVRAELSIALREVAPFSFGHFGTDAEGCRQSVIRSARRRLAAAMDEYVQHIELLKSWEQYIYPPVSSSPCLGDVYQRAGCPADDAESFIVILTPSCDLVCNGTRKAKVAQVLAANCVNIESGLKCLNQHDARADKLQKFLQVNVLSHGFSKEIVPIPELSGRIPEMFLNLKSLLLVDLNELSNQDHFRRIASIDSPFRELISWAYLQTAARPGLPERDFDDWSKSIVAGLQRTKNVIPQ